MAKWPMSNSVLSFRWREAGTGLIALKAPIQSGHRGVVHPTNALPPREGEAGVLDKVAEGHDLGPTSQQDLKLPNPSALRRT